MADEFAEVREGLFYWEAYDPAVKADLCSCAVRTAEGMVFIDPIPLAKAALAELLADAPPAAIVCTNANHLRGAEELRVRLKIPLLAHAGAAEELGATADGALAEGDRVAGELAVVELPGAAAGEIGLWNPSGAFHAGDALLNLPPYGFAPLPEKYCRDHQALLTSLRKLLGLSFEVLTFAHGQPIVAQARARLEQMLASG